MAISFVTGGYVVNAVYIPAAVEAGDFILVYAIGDDAPLVGGWTVLAKDTSPGRWFLGYRVADAVDAASTGTNNYTFGLAVEVSWAVYRGGPSGLVIDVASPNHAETAITQGQSMDVASMVATRAGLLVTSHGVMSSGVGIGTPTGMTKRTETHGSSFYKGGMFDVAVSVGSTGLKSAPESGIGSGTFISSWSSGVVIGEANTPPNAPPLAVPSNAAVVDLAAGTTFEAAFSDPDPGDTPSAAYFRRKLVGAASYEYYNAGTGAFQSTEVKRSGTSEEWTFGAGKWSNSASYNWSVAYEDALGEPGPYAADFTVSGSSLPSVTVTGPTGTTTDTSRPPITWSMSDPDGDPQERYHAKYFTEAAATTVGFDPETTTAAWNSTETVSESAREAAPDVDLDNATTYRGYAKVRAGGQWSGWEYSATTISLTPPDAPTLTVVEDPADGRNVLTVTGTHDTGDFPDVTYRVEYSDDDGDTWATLRDADALEPDVDLEAVAYDYEAPLFRARTYRATTDAAV